MWTGNLSKRPDHAYHGMRVVRDSLARLGVVVSDEQAYALQGLSRDRYPSGDAEIRELAELIGKLRLKYLATIARNERDVAAINDDASIRLWLLAALAARRSPGLAASVAMAATRIRPLSVFAFTGKVAQRVLRR
jgi:hypothetical protein